MNKITKPSIFFGLLIALIFFIAFFILAGEDGRGSYVMYAALGLGAIYWVWSIIAVIVTDDLKKYQRTFWLIIVVAIPYFGALLFGILHQSRNKIAA